MTDCPGVDCVTQNSSETPLTDDGIRLLVDRFYVRVRQDALLGPVFTRAIADDAWPQHLATMRDFWSSVMLTSGRYHGNPVAVHRRLDGIKPAHFERWLALFGETCRELFGDETAATFMDKANRIATSLQLAMFYRPENDEPALQQTRAAGA